MKKYLEGNFQNFDIFVCVGEPQEKQDDCIFYRRAVYVYTENR